MRLLVRIPLGSRPPQKLIMAHALRRVVFSTADTKKSLFALVARNPTSQTDPEGVYCHVFQLPSREAVRVTGGQLCPSYLCSLQSISAPLPSPPLPSPRPLI